MAHAIGTRAARLAGIATGAVIIKTGALGNDLNLNPVQPGFESDQGVLVDIAVDGSVIEHYPGFEAIMRETFYVIPGIGIKGDESNRFGLAKDGSSVGAAVIALMASS